MRLNHPDEVALQTARALLRTVWFILRAIWYQHVAGPGRLYLNGVMLVVVGVGYLYHERYGWGDRVPIYLLAGVIVFACARYGIFCRRRRRVERNAAGVIAGAFGVPAEEQVVRVRRWRGRQPAELQAVIPPKIRRSELQEIETQVGQRLAAPTGREWNCSWDLMKHRLALTSVPAIPDMVRYQETVCSVHLRWHEFALAVGRSGLVKWNCLRLPHVLIAGTTGGGKSTALLTLLAGALSRPDKWLVQCVDLKRVELGHLQRNRAVRVATDLDSALNMIRALRDLMHERYQTMEAEGVKHFKRLSERQPAVLFVVDELAELVSPSGIKTKEAKEEDEKRAACLTAIEAIARMGRAAGVHLVLATQRPDATILPGSLKINIEARLALGRLNPISSEMVIESRAAAELPGIQGRGLWRTSQIIEEVQVLWTDEHDLSRAVTTASRRGSGQAARGAWWWPKPPRRRRRRPAQR